MNTSSKNSLAVWIDGTQEYYTYSLDVNLKITGPTTERFIEIGLTVHEVEGAKKINLFCPFQIDSSCIENLGETLTKKPDTLGAMFNSTVSVSSDPTNASSEVTLNGTKKLHICTLGSDIFDVTPCENDSSLISINFDNCISKKTNNGSYYFRFRLNKLQGLHEEESGTPYWFAGKKEEYSYLDFRVNMPRSLPNSIAVKAFKDKLLRIHVFLLVDTSQKIVFGTKSPKDTRLLEKDDWKGYFPKKNKAFSFLHTEEDKAKIVAYHWKKEYSYENDANNDYDLFVKLITEKSNKKIILTAAIFTLIFGSASGVLGNYAFKALEDTTYPDALSKPNQVKKAENPAYDKKTQIKLSTQPNSKKTVVGP
ncbi:hypothetical protein [Hydrogenovibrio kuenenii]|uniref:hypothetical protein n=1 Tax=Hydrogenovibrio kuenenii TaxID=63658 RepID=UPI0004676630|nr:hypothetical protein [Hydrogenovibrio kuenenii]